MEEWREVELNTIGEKPMNGRESERTDRGAVGKYMSRKNGVMTKFRELVERNTYESDDSNDERGEDEWRNPRVR